ncbi:hypothetical protein Tco_1348382, partial [Tanacetum coccineum]
MTDSIQLYAVKIVIRTVFGPWLDLPSHHNDNHFDALCLATSDKKGWAGLHHIDAIQDSIPIVNLDPTPAKKIQAWFDSSIPFFNGIVDEDGKSCGDDFVLISKDNSIDEDCNVCEDASAGLSKDEIVNDKLVDEDCNVCEDASAGLSKDNVVNEKSVGNNDQLLLEDGDGLFDLKAGCRNSEEDNENQPANVSIRDLYIVVKVHGERIANLERLLKEKQSNDYAAENTKPNMIPNHSDDIPSLCSRPDMHNAKVGCDVADLPELDVLQHEAHVDRSRPKINQHPMVEPLTADEFWDNYMSVLNDEEMIPNLIDAQKDTTNLLPENMKDEINKSKYVNVVKADYKPPLEIVFAANIKSKKKKCGLQKKYVLRSIQEQKKRLAMALGSPYGQLGTTTP